MYTRPRSDWFLRSYFSRWISPFFCATDRCGFFHCNVEKLNKSKVWRDSFSPIRLVALNCFVDLSIFVDYCTAHIACYSSLVSSILYYPKAIEILLARWHTYKCMTYLRFSSADGCTLHVSFVELGAFRNAALPWKCISTATHAIACTSGALWCTS